jgi:hypothetical protein
MVHRVERMKDRQMRSANLMVFSLKENHSFLFGFYIILGVTPFCLREKEILLPFFPHWTFAFNSIDLEYLFQQVFQSILPH